MPAIFNPKRTIYACNLFQYARDQICLKFVMESRDYDWSLLWKWLQLYLAEPCIIRSELNLYLVKKAAAAILSSILKSSSIFFSSKRWTFFRSSIPSNEWKLFPVSSLTTVGNLVFVFARWRLVSIQANIAEADRRPWRTAPLCNRAHIGSRFRNKYAIFPMAVWSAISFNLLHVDLINSFTWNIRNPRSLRRSFYPW